MLFFIKKIYKTFLQKKIIGCMTKKFTSYPLFLRAEN